MRRLLYVSAAAVPATEATLDDILKTSRANNARAGVTGILLHIDSGFLQILEGPDDTVAQTYARIAKDARHRSLRTLIDEPAEERLFADWSMGFDRPKPGASGAFEITRDAIEGVVPQDKARTLAVLLRTFYTVNLGPGGAR